jgi:quaternary ammonium compound-resistance protein SugE
MAWILLGIAGILEVVWAIGLKQSKGFTVLVPSIVTIIAMLLSFWLLAQALRTLPVGTGYAVWTGIGTVGAAIFGMIIFNEPRDITRIFCIGLIVCGILGLKFVSSS